MTEQETKKSERLFDLTVTGFTAAGYTVTLAASMVDNENLAKFLAWSDERLAELGVRPSLLPTVHIGKSAVPLPETQMCPIHNEPMELHTKGTAHWYSHKVLGGDLGEFWCRGKKSA